MIQNNSGLKRSSSQNIFAELGRKAPFSAIFPDICILNYIRVRENPYCKQMFGIQLFGICHVPFFEVKLTGVDPDEDKEQGNKNGPEDKTDKPKEPHPDNNPETGDQGVHVANAPERPEPEQVIDRADDPKTI